jgi:hypothetical protein
MIIGCGIWGNGGFIACGGLGPGAWYGYGLYEGLYEGFWPV